MASSTMLLSCSQISCQCLLAPTRISGLKLVSFSRSGRSNLPLSFRRLAVSCAAKQETVEKVCGIVRKQLALNDDTLVTGDSKLFALGTDSIDMFEILMELEKEFGIGVLVLESAESVQDAADLIDKIIDKTSTA